MKNGFLILIVAIILTSCSSVSKVSQEHEQKVVNLISALSEGEICYNFNSIKDITPTNLNMYLSRRYPYYFKNNEIVFNDTLEGHLSYEQAMTIIKSDFRDDDLEFIKPNTSFYIQAGLQGKDGSLINVIYKNNCIIARVEYSYFPSSMLENADYAIVYHMEYTFEISSNGELQIKSGKLLY